jgi:hypothetical protein
MSVQQYLQQLILEIEFKWGALNKLFGNRQALDGSIVCNCTFLGCTREGHMLNCDQLFSSYSHQRRDKHTGHLLFDKMLKWLGYKM